MKNRNIKIFSFVLCLVAMLFALGLNRTSAETPGVTVSGKLVDTIKNIKVTNNEGEKGGFYSKNTNSRIEETLGQSDGIIEEIETF